MESVYREAELLRKRKLQAARREREKIVAEEERRDGERRSEVDRGSHFGLREARGSGANAHETVLPMASLTHKVM